MSRRRALGFTLAALLAVPAAAEERLVGRWSATTPYPFTLELAADGSGSLVDGEGVPAEPIRYRVQGATLLVEEDGDTTPYAFSLSGDELRLSGGDLDQALVLNRAPRQGGRASAPGSLSNSSNKNPHPTAGRSGAAPPSVGGSCAGACRHLVACVGAGPADGARCLGDCQAAGYAPGFLKTFEQADCATAIAIAQALSGAGQQGQAQGLPGKPSDCNGCVWDGDTCAWYSQSNWGSNVAYSGAVMTCDSACCGH